MRTPAGMYWPLERVKPLRTRREKLAVGFVRFSNERESLGVAY
jgi:hypothetical protein